ncbi:carboxylesterase [Cytobacillus oceanisediminis]|uniref:alpha/beta hydrolase n=1 Tax=Bacillaceae TaxID=186817 RepID=UPI001CCB4BA8|nr:MULTISPECIES: carboxylesterase [Bacillaceae]MBQ6445932.1 carboxylesterase [Bacillus sp. (in: firmicutes)]MBZ9534591.1 carboxylesterase [Cytobacillus oceanisediminis]MDU1847299.1 carboxylesterase [Niallia nealsonii]MED3790941.1 carboxylesterase [Niallia alba]
MKIVEQKPLTFKGDNKRAVLLLHGFTGNTSDVRLLGRYLNTKGYTCYVPLYKGHGVPPEELVEYGPKDWWKDVTEAYQHLKEMGFEEIAVGGLSLGGVFSLKLGYTVPVKGIVTMCAPMYIKSEEVMYEGVLEYARHYKQREKKSEEVIEQEMAQFKPMNTLKELQNLIKEVRESIDLIYSPVFVIQARHDQMIDTNSANIIYEEVESIQKDIKWYENSRHVITHDKEKEQVFEDFYQFLEKLDWKE